MDRRVAHGVSTMLGCPPATSKTAGDESPRRTEVREFKGIVHIQLRDTKIEEFGDLELVSPAKDADSGSSSAIDVSSTRGRRANSSTYGPEYIASMRL